MHCQTTISFPLYFDIAWHAMEDHCVCPSNKAFYGFAKGSSGLALTTNQILFFFFSLAEYKMKEMVAWLLQATHSDYLQLYIVRPVVTDYSSAC